MEFGVPHSVRSEEGSSGVEYGILISTIVLVIVGIIRIFGDRVSSLYANVF